MYLYCETINKKDRHSFVSVFLLPSQMKGGLTMRKIQSINYFFNVTVVSHILGGKIEVI